jgi:Spy/CpxP family protein refolding chaperone
MNAKNIILSLLAAAVIAAAPAAAIAADAEQPSRPCPQRMIGCEYDAHKACEQAELTPEQKAEMKAKCEAARAKFAEMKAKKEKKEMAFATIKSWFLELFPKFNVNKAKMEIKAKKLEKAKDPYKVVKVWVKAPHSSNK